MTYQDTLTWLFSQLPMYQKTGQKAYKANLINTINLAKHLNNPENNFKSIHVAGTNGKGSSSHMLASILQEAGYKVGLYTSPHLKDFRERIKVNGEMLSEQFVVDFVEDNKTFFEKNNLSFFEMTVGMAFDYFSNQRVDIAVIEVGLGGRLDSTNIITPQVSVITNIGLDHTQFLGDTLPAIALEKGGIIKPNVPVVIGETQDETAPVFINLAHKNKAPITFADQEVLCNYKSDLKGSYQVKNIKTVVQALKVLNKKGYTVSNNNITAGLLNVVCNTKLLGRWQVLNTAPKIVCDTGHNKEGLFYVMDQLQKETYNKLHIVFGVVKDKDLTSIVGLLPQKAVYYFCKPEISRGLDATLLQKAFFKYNLIGAVYSTVNEAYSQAINNADSNDFIFIGGSTFVVAEII